MSINTDYLALVTGFVTTTGDPVAPLKVQLDECFKIVAVVNLVTQ